jgi:hypothetical protein
MNERITDIEIAILELAKSIERGDIDGVYERVHEIIRPTKDEQV